MISREKRKVLKHPFSLASALSLLVYLFISPFDAVISYYQGLKQCPTS